MPDKDALLRRLAELESDPRWRAVKSPPHVESWRLDHDALPYPVVRCAVELGCPAAELMAFLVDDITETLPAWSRDIDACDEIERISPDERILLVRTRGPVRIIAAREDLFYVHRGEAQPGDFYEVSVVVDTPAVPIAPGAVRSHMYFASKRIRSRPSGCFYEVLWQYDPRGLMAKLLPRSVTVAAVHNHMKDECLKLRSRFGSPA